MIININRLITLLVIILILGAIAAYLSLDGFEELYLFLSVVGILLFLLLQFPLRLAFRNFKNKKIISSSKNINAKITGISYFPDTYSPTHIVLQLLVNPDNRANQYMTSYVIQKPNTDQKNFVIENKIIYIYADPKTPGKHIIPAITEKAATPQNVRNLLAEKGWILIPIVSAGFPVFFFLSEFLLLSTSDSFATLAYISGKQETVWELSYKRESEEPYKGIYYINIYDPLNDENIKKIKQKKESIPQAFSVIQNNNKVWVISNQLYIKPIIDVYDANTYEQTGDIESFIKTHPFMRNGIASLNFLRVSDNYVFKQTDVLEIITTDGEKMYFDIITEAFINPDEDLGNMLWRHDSLEISTYRYSFFLAHKDDEYEILTLNKAQSTIPSELKYIWELSGSEQNINSYYVFNDTAFHVKYTNITPGKYFLRGQIIYHDSSLVAIYHASKLRKGAPWLISCVDKTGKILFSVDQSQFPNREEFTEYYNSSSSPGNFAPTATRNKDYLVMTFDIYGANGAICVDIKSGKIIWKHEASK